MEKILESPLDSKEIESVNPKGNQPWIFTGKTNAEAEAPIIWQPDEKYWLIGWGDQTLILGKIEGKKRMWQEMICLDSMTDSMNMNLSEFWEIIKDRENWCTEVHWVAEPDMNYWLNKNGEWKQVKRDCICNSKIGNTNLY